MKFDPQKHHRRSIRLKEYDYSQAGVYFVTIVAWQRECLFGEIVDGEMMLNNVGKIIQKWWDEIAEIGCRMWKRAHSLSCQIMYMEFYHS